MRIAIGLPSTIGSIDGDELLRWAEHADAVGFDSIGVIDRLVYDNYEPIVTLAASAGVTRHARLLTFLAILPYRQTALFAKQAASLDRISGGRLTLGVGIGGRADDYAAQDVATAGRGRRLEEQIVTCKQIWSGNADPTLAGVGPQPVQPGGPPLIVGGAKAGIERAARVGDGWMAGWPAHCEGGDPHVVSGRGSEPLSLTSEIRRLRSSWQNEGRDGTPLVYAATYFALGPEAAVTVERYLRGWYGFDGGLEHHAVAGPALDPSTVRGYIASFEGSGCDELILAPCTTDLAEIDRLAAVAL